MIISCDMHKCYRAWWNMPCALLSTKRGNVVAAIFWCHWTPDMHESSHNRYCSRNAASPWATWKENRTDDPPRASNNRDSPLDQDHSIIAATNSTLYLGSSARATPVFLKVGEIAPLGAILICKEAKKTKGAIGGRNSTKGAKMLNH